MSGFDAWWRGSVIYQIYPRSFQDSNADGIGDLNGITSRLDHIAELGADAIWISPFFTSPMRDFGYDVADYCGVDPLFGTIEDFRSLLVKAHARGLKVIIDQVWSHTSDQHPWFSESRADAAGAYANWYVWADAKPDGGPPNNWLSVFGGSAWTWDTGRRQYYLHNFLSEQPDLNFHEPAVQDAILDVARFWLDMGVDGFRLDVCNFYFHDRTLADNPPRSDGRRSTNPHDWQAHVHCRSQPENLIFLSRLRAFVDTYGDRALMGEIGDDQGLVRMIEYTQGRDRLHMAYCFDLLGTRHDAPFLHTVLTRYLSAGDGWASWALGNHDFRRLATRWEGGSAQLRLYAALQICLRGSPCLYQGEELGLPQAEIAFEELQDPVGKAMWPADPGRDGCRTPMPWVRNAPHAGFSEAVKCWLPVPDTHRGLAAAVQEGDPTSLLNYYRALLGWRRNHPVLATGAMRMLPVHEQCLAFVREDSDGRLLCAFNLSGACATLSLPDGYTTLHKSPMEGATISSEGLVLQLAPWAAAVVG